MTTDPKDAEIARLTAANVQLQYIATTNQTRAEKAEAERDAALAQVAGAYHHCLKLLREVGVAGDGGEDPMSQMIMDQCPADAKAALDKLLQEAWAEGRKAGLREAAEIAAQWGAPGVPTAFWPHEIGRAILAAAEKGAANG